MLTNNAVIR